MFPRINTKQAVSLLCYSFNLISLIYKRIKKIHNQIVRILAKAHLSVLFYYQVSMSIQAHVKIMQPI